MEFETIAIHKGQPPDPLTGAVNIPIYQTSTYAQKFPGKHKGYEYSRTQNPTRKALEENLSALEGGKYGLAFSSGMSAVSNVLNLLKNGDNVVACDDLYGGTRRIFMDPYTQYGITFEFIDARNVANVENAIKENTKLLWIETPTNPLMRIVDIRKIAEIAHKKDIIVVVDNTFATPYLQKPLALGADIVVHSTTKYLGGHSDIIGGAVITSDKTIYEKLKFYQNAVGAVPGPFDCFLVLRGIKTLALRMERHSENAKKIAEYLKTLPEVKKVYYPGIPTHPQYELAKTQMRLPGGMISFELNLSPEKVKKFVSSTKIFYLAESLGGVESLIEHPASMTHSSIQEEERKKIGISDSLVRLSVGIENVNDLIEDLKSAFKSVKQGGVIPIS